jgi:hypothetical protein
MCAKRRYKPEVIHPHHKIRSQQPITFDLRNTGALVNYLHKAMFSCSKYSLVHAVKKGHLGTWPGLTEEAINKYLKMTPATAMGYMNQKRQNIRSTNEKVKSESKDVDITPRGSSEKTI